MLVAEVRKKREKIHTVRVTPIQYYTGNLVNTLNDDNNSLATSYYGTNSKFQNLRSESNNLISAKVEAFRLLSQRKRYVNQLKGFDMALCQYLVNKYHLSCTDCHIEKCEFHGLDQFR